MTPPAVLLDVDGTLVDSNYQHALSWHRAFAQHGCGIPAWRTHRAIGMGGDMLVPALAGEEWAAEHGEAVRATEAALFGELIDRVAPLPGARAFLELLALRGHAVVLSSSAKAHELEHYVELLGARDLVQAATTSADVERTKPEPDVDPGRARQAGRPRARRSWSATPSTTWSPPRARSCRRSRCSPAASAPASWSRRAPRRCSTTCPR